MKLRQIIDRNILIILCVFFPGAAFSLFIFFQIGYLYGFGVGLILVGLSIINVVRWNMRLDLDSLFIISLIWPAFPFFAWWMIQEQEKQRRLYIIRDVMDS